MREKKLTEVKRIQLTQQLTESNHQENRSLKPGKKPSGLNWLSKMTITLVSLITRTTCQATYTTRGPLLEPTVSSEGVTFDSSWSNTDGSASTTTQKGSRIGTSRFILYTSYGVAASSGPAVTIFDSSSSTVQPVMSNDGNIGITNHFTSFALGGNKFAVVDVRQGQPLVRILNNNRENKPEVINTLPVMPNSANPICVFYDEQRGLVIMGTSSGVYIYDLADEASGHVQFNEFDNTNSYSNLVRDMTEGATMLFTVGSTDMVLKLIDYTTDPTTATPDKEVSLSSRATAIAQADQNPLSMLVGLFYADDSNHLAYISDLTSETVSIQIVLDNGGTNDVDFNSIWPISGSNFFYVAAGSKVTLLELASYSIEQTDVTSTFISESDAEILTSVVYFPADDYFVISGYKQGNYGFIKKMELFGDCHSTCKTCSFGADKNKCLQCKTGNYLYSLGSSTQCIPKNDCKAIQDFYVYEISQECISETDCLNKQNMVIKSESECVIFCPETHPYLLEDADPTPPLKECLSKDECQNDKLDYSTLDEAKTCIKNEDCIGSGTGQLSYVIIKETSNCVPTCADDPAGLSLWKDKDNYCVTKSVCQSLTQNPRTYTRNLTTGFLCTETCNGADDLVVDGWFDCVTTCRGYPIPVWESGDFCVTTEKCHLERKFTDYESGKCHQGQDCTDEVNTDDRGAQIGGNYAIVKNLVDGADDLNICVRTCGVGMANDYPYSMEDPDTADSSAFNMCFTLKTCKEAGHFIIRTTYECVTHTQCHEKNMYAIAGDIKECIPSCREHELGTHTYHEIGLTLNTCVDATGCAASGKYIDEISKTCVSEKECRDKSRFFNETHCMLTCGTIGKYGLEIENAVLTDESDEENYQCLTLEECQARVDPSDATLTYNTRDYDSKCVTRNTCTEDGYHAAVGSNTCVVDCNSDTSLYLDSTTDLCFTAAECAAKGNLFFRKKGTCLLVATCIADYYQIAENDECIDDCNSSDYPYLDLENASDKNCTSQTQCNSLDKYVDKIINACVTDDECKTSGKYTIEYAADDLRCVEVCPQGYFIFEGSRTIDSASKDVAQCVTQTTCIDPVAMEAQYYVLEDDINKCISKSACTTLERFVNNDPSQMSCVADCVTQNLRTYSDETTEQCVTDLQCQTELGRYTFNETMQCVTDTICTTTKASGTDNLEGKIVGDIKDCVRTCDDALEGYNYLEKSSMTKCHSFDSCTVTGSNFIHNDLDLCVTADECKSLGRYTTSDSHCVDTCPDAEFRLELTTEFKCITATECEDLTEGTPAEKFYKLEVDINRCVSESVCTGTDSTDYSRYLVNATWQCVDDCATVTGYEFTDEETSICHSLEGCQSFDSTESSDPNRLAKLDTEECITEAKCTADGYLMIIDESGTDPIRMCVKDCSQHDTHRYQKGLTAPTLCLSEVQCDSTDGFGYIREDGGFCMNLQECHDTDGYALEVIIGTGFGKCVYDCPEGKYKFAHETNDEHYCLTAEECYFNKVINASTTFEGKNLYTDDEFGTCVTLDTCTGNDKKTLTDNSNPNGLKSCENNCSLHATHKWTNAMTCLTGLECQTAGSRFTQNSTYQCVDAATCSADNMVTNPVNSLNDCAFYCPIELYKSGSNICLTQAECQSIESDPVNQGYTLVAEYPENLCVSKTECDARGYFTNEVVHECLSVCPKSWEGNNFLTLPSAKKCYSEQECKDEADHFIFKETSQCIQKDQCNVHEYFTIEYTMDECVKECPATYYTYNPNSQRECVTETDCIGKPGITYVEKSTFNCYTKAECTSENKYSLASTDQCYAMCPAGYYGLDSDNTCIDAAECIDPTGNNLLTLNNTRKCISQIECANLGMVVSTEYSDCSCPSETPYWDRDDQLCLNDFQCVSSGKYTQNDTKLCLTKDECSTIFTPGPGFTVEKWSDCVSDCNVAGTLEFTLKRTTFPENICASQLMCESYDQGYVTTDNECMTKVECTNKGTGGYYTLLDQNICIDACANSPTHTFIDDVNKNCYTGKGCQAQTNMYTYNSTSECINLAECIVTKGEFIIKEWSDCINECPNVPGQHRFLEETGSECLTADQCQSKVNFYTLNDTRTCIDESTCTGTGSKKVLKEWSDCIQDCDSHPTHSYDFATSECLSAENCVALPDGFTLDTTSPKTCVDRITCTSVPSYTVRSTKQCLTPCPDDFLLQGDECLTPQECYSQGFFSNIAVSQCLQVCPDPLFHDLSTLACVAQCPDGSYTSEEDRKCFTRNTCLADSANRWIYPATMACSSQCNLAKDPGTRSCISPSSCEDKSVSSGEECYVEISVNAAKNSHSGSVPTTTEATTPEGETPQEPASPIQRVVDADSDRVTIDLNLDIPVSDLENFVERVTFRIAQDSISRRVLQSGEISFFNFNQGGAPGQYSIDFDAPISEEFDIEIEFKNNIEVYYQADGDAMPTLHRVDLQNLSFRIPGKVKDDYRFSQGVTLAYDLILKVVPVTAVAIQSISPARLMPLMSDNYNKLVVYSRSSSMAMRDEEIRNTHNVTFMDWGSHLNRFVIRGILPASDYKDIQMVCQESTSYSCFKRRPANLITNKSLFLIVLLALIVFMKKPRVKSGMLPVFWISSQLFFNYDMINNISYLKFTGAYQIIGILLSMIISIIVLGLTLQFVFDRSEKARDYRTGMHKYLFHQIFKSTKLMQEYFVVKLLAGFFISVFVSAMESKPKPQIIIVMLIELALFASSFRGYFKLTAFNCWNIITSALFFILSIILVVLAFSKSSSTKALDTMIVVISWLVISIDCLAFLFSFRLLKSDNDGPLSATTSKKSDFLKAKMMSGVSEGSDENEISDLNNIQRISKTGGSVKVPPIAIKKSGNKSKLAGFSERDPSQKLGEKSFIESKLVNSNKKRNNGILDSEPNSDQKSETDKMISNQDSNAISSSFGISKEKNSVAVSKFSRKL